MSNTRRRKTVDIEESIVKKIEKLAREEHPKGSGKSGNFSVMCSNLLIEALRGRGLIK